MRSYFLMAITAILLGVGCARNTGTGQLESDAAGIAREFIEMIENSGDYRGAIAWNLMSADRVQTLLQEKGLNQEDLHQSTLALLKDSTPKARVNAIRLLSFLAHEATHAEIVAAMDDADQDVRFEACWVFHRLQASQEIKDALFIKRRDDESPCARVAAAFALNKRNDEDALAAFQAGLLDSRVRDLCVRELKRQGKLKLPLPLEVYERMTPSDLEFHLSVWKRSSITNEVRQNGKVYFQASRPASGPFAIPSDWYWMPEEEFDKKP